jgi:hypothetical protein
VGKKELGGDPDFFSIIVLFSVGNFVYQMRSIEFSETHFCYHHRFPNQTGGIDLQFKPSRRGRSQSHP